MGYADNKDDIEYILSIDNSDPDYYEYIRIFNDKELDRNILNADNDSAIQAINRGASICRGDVIIVVSDDFSCNYHWDTLLTKELSGKYDFVLKTKDGIQPMLVTLPIMDRAYYLRYGYVYSNDYSHMYADQELTAVSAMTGKLIFSDLEFLHQHYTTGKTPKDAINDKNDLTYQNGANIFQRNLLYNFGIEKPVIKYSEIIWH